MTSWHFGVKSYAFLWLFYYLFPNCMTLAFYSKGTRMSSESSWKSCWDTYMYMQESLHPTNEQRKRKGYSIVRGLISGLSILPGKKDFFWLLGNTFTMVEENFEFFTALKCSRMKDRRAGGLGAEGAENSASLFTRIDTIFPIVYYLLVWYITWYPVCVK